MTYFTQNITTAEWVEKKQFYKSLWMQDFTTWEIVQVRQWDWEYSKADLEEIKTNIQTQLDAINEKIALFE